MRRLQLDFAPDRTVRNAALNATLCGLIAALAYLAWDYAETAKRANMLETDLARIAAAEAGVRAHDRSRPDAARRDAEVKLANQVIDRLALPWDQLFDEIESSVDENVILLGVEPDAEKRHVKITAEARDLKAMSAYVKRLGLSQRFRDAHLQSHQVQVANVQRPVRFIVAARWLGDRPSAK